MMNYQDRRASLYILRLFGILFGLLIGFCQPGLSASEREADILVPIDPYRLPEGLTLVGPPLKEIEVRVRGAPSALEYLALNKPRYSLDLSSVAIGVESIPINADMLQMPDGVKITRVNPAYLTVRVDRQLKKQVPVMVSVSGKPAASFFIDDLLTNPSTVLLCGPETVLASIDAVLTKPIDVNGRAESFKKETALDLKAGVGVCASSGIVLAEIYLAEKEVTRRFTDILVEGQDTPFKFSISPPTITIEIKGPQKIVENLDPQKDIRVRVELKDLNPGVYVRRATITLPVKTSLVIVEPKLFTVKLSRGKQ
ncbi:MAG: CdaR family protein [Desulfobacterales bacterium]|jgi:YbbR domain-containing protein